MDKQKSPIDSFNVSLGPSPADRPTARRVEPWNILVCSDLGFTSTKPQQARIAEWNEFMRSQNIVLSGRVENTLTTAGKPFYMEYPVQSMKDFSAGTVEKTIPELAAFSRVLAALQRLLEGKTGCADAASMVKDAGLPVEEERRVLGMLGPAPSAPKLQGKSADSPIDRILSMVGPATAAPGPHRPHSEADAAVAGALFHAVVDAPESYDKAKVSAYVAECTARLKNQSDAITAQPFFAMRMASWNCLMTLAKTVGRQTSASIGIFSSPAEDMPGCLVQVLGWCMEAGEPPDIVVWDYDVSFSNASVGALAAVAEAAERYKCMVIAPIAGADPLLDGISGRSSVSHLFEDVRFLPYKKLRENTHTRCLCLCAPPLVFDGPKDGPLQQNCRSPWYAAIRWAGMLLFESNPFGAHPPQPATESVFSGEPVLVERIAPGIAAEAAGMGLTLFSDSPEGKTLDKAVAVISGDEVDKSFTSFLFNLLVNRVIRLCGIRVLAAGAGEKKEDVAAALQEFVRRDLAACGIASGGAAVNASVQGAEVIQMAVDSETAISGYRVRFSFSI
jgi:predicted component of type VI protein secretion system